MLGDESRSTFPVDTFEDLREIPLLSNVLAWLESKRSERAPSLELVVERLVEGDSQLLLVGLPLAKSVDSRLEAILRWALDRGGGRADDDAPPGSFGLEGDLPTTAEVFGEEGLLARLFQDFRPQQELMAERIGASIEAEEILVVEAGTGVGKSLGYLIPAMKSALETGRRVVISTHTKNLQAQLLDKDIPLAHRLLGIPVDAALLMGRSNYVCARALNALLARISGFEPLLGGELIQEHDWTPRALLVLILAVLLDDEGILESFQTLKGMPKGGLEQLGGHEERCSPEECSRRRSCFLRRARLRANRANLVVVNHALLLSDHLTAAGILGDYDVLVIDEAHHLENVATKQLEITLEPGSFLAAVASFGERLEGGDTNSKLALRRVLETAGRDSLQGFDTAWSSLEDAYSRSRDVLPQMFRALSRVHASSHAPGKHRYTGLDDPFAEVREEVTRALNSLRDLQDRMAAFLEPLGAETGGDSDRGQELYDLNALWNAARSALSKLQFLFDANDPGYVYWMSLSGRKRVTSLGASPVRVARELESLLTGGPRGVVLTSATLAVGDRFDYLLGNLGIEREDRVSTLKLASPFDYESQSLFLLAGYMPSPTEPAYSEEVSRVLTRLSGLGKKRILALFTSAAMLREVAGRLHDSPDLEGPLLVQDGGADRVELSRRFVAERGSVLLGLASFWEGVDFPGDALEILVVARLPFPVPADPLVQARSESIEAEGGNGFADYMVPEAILRFRQGMGRLIRTRRDRGIVVILDSRLARRGYGLRMLEALPVHPSIHQDEEMLLREAVRFFENGPVSA